MDFIMFNQGINKFMYCLEELPIIYINPIFFYKSFCTQWTAQNIILYYADINMILTKTYIIQGKIIKVKESEIIMISEEGIENFGFLLVITDCWSIVIQGGDNRLVTSY